MSRSVVVGGLLLLMLGLGVFAWKAWWLEMPLMPRAGEGPWRVELEVSARGAGRRGSVRVPLPSSGPGQAVFDERTVSDRLLFTIRTEDGQRLGVWSGRFEGVHDLVHGFRVELAEIRTSLPEDPPAEPDPELSARYGAARSGLRPDEPAVVDLLARLPLPAPTDPIGRLRALFGFVSDEIATVDTAADDPLLTLEAREGSPTGKTRLLVALLRTAGIPSRIVLGLGLSPHRPPEESLWAEAWMGDRWIPMSPVEGFFAVRPADRVALRIGSDVAIDTTGVQAVGRRYFALREELRPEELEALMVPPSPVLAALSLYRLPVSTQSLLRALLLLPLGALMVALFRNVVGVPTFGTFMPILIAFALRGYPLGTGLLLAATVLAVGILGRLLLDRLRLLLVPRLSVLLCMVVLAVTLAALLGRGRGYQELFSGLLLPMVILTMLIERFSVTVAEEGWRAALEKLLYTGLVLAAVYPVFRSPVAQHLMFGFPELVLAVMGLLVWIGGYAGFRLTDLIRFRDFARMQRGSS